MGDYNFKLMKVDQFQVDEGLIGMNFEQGRKR